MGYRSDVHIAITKRALTTLTVAGYDVGILSKLSVSNTTHNHYIHYYMENLKWYDMFQDVQSVNSLFDFLQDNGDEAEYAFVRFGEDFDDTEVSGDYWEFFALSRSADPI